MVRITVTPTGRDWNTLSMSDETWADLVELIKAIDLPEAPPGQKRAIGYSSVAVERISEMPISPGSYGDDPEEGPLQDEDEEN